MRTRTGASRATVSTPSSSPAHAAALGFSVPSLVASGGAGGAAGAGPALDPLFTLTPALSALAVLVRPQPPQQLPGTMATTASAGAGGVETAGAMEAGYADVGASLAAYFLIPCSTGNPTGTRRGGDSDADGKVQRDDDGEEDDVDVDVALAGATRAGLPVQFDLQPLPARRALSASARGEAGEWGAAGEWEAAGARASVLPLMRAWAAPAVPESTSASTSTSSTGQPSRGPPVVFGLSPSALMDVPRLARVLVAASQGGFSQFVEADGEGDVAASSCAEADASSAAASACSATRLPRASRRSVFIARPVGALIARVFLRALAQAYAATHSAAHSAAQSAAHSAAQTAVVLTNAEPAFLSAPPALALASVALPDAQQAARVALAAVLGPPHLPDLVSSVFGLAPPSAAAAAGGASASPAGAAAAAIKAGLGSAVPVPAALASLLGGGGGGGSGGAAAGLPSAAGSAVPGSGLHMMQLMQAPPFRPVSSAMLCNGLAPVSAQVQARAVARGAGAGAGGGAGKGGAGGGGGKGAAGSAPSPPHALSQPPFPQQAELRTAVLALALLLQLTSHSPAAPELAASADLNGGNAHSGNGNSSTTSAPRPPLTTNGISLLRGLGFDVAQLKAAGVTSAQLAALTKTISVPGEAAGDVAKVCMTSLLAWSPLVIAAPPASASSSASSPSQSAAVAGALAGTLLLDGLSRQLAAGAAGAAGKPQSLAVQGARTQQGKGKTPAPELAAEAAPVACLPVSSSSAAAAAAAGPAVAAGPAASDSAAASVSASTADAADVLDEEDDEAGGASGGAGGGKGSAAAKRDRARVVREQRAKAAEQRRLALHDKAVSAARAAVLRCADRAVQLVEQRRAEESRKAARQDREARQREAKQREAKEQEREREREREKEREREVKQREEATAAVSPRIEAALATTSPVAAAAVAAPHQETKGSGTSSDRPDAAWVVAAPSGIVSDESAGVITPASSASPTETPIGGHRIGPHASSPGHDAEVVATASEPSLDSAPSSVSAATSTAAGLPANVEPDAAAVPADSSAHTLEEFTVPLADVDGVDSDGEGSPSYHRAPGATPIVAALRMAAAARGPPLILPPMPCDSAFDPPHASPVVDATPTLSKASLSTAPGDEPASLKRKGKTAQAHATTVAASDPDSAAAASVAAAASPERPPVTNAGPAPSPAASPSSSSSSFSSSSSAAASSPAPSSSSSQPPAIVAAGAQAAGPQAAGAQGAVDATAVSLGRDMLELASALEHISELRRPWKQAVINAARTAVASLWPDARVEVYGSFATGLCAPSSDIDLVICGVRSHYKEVMAGSGGNSAKTAKLLTDELRVRARSLAAHLHRQTWTQNVVCVERTQIPIVKCTSAFKEAGANIQLDFSFDSPSHRGLSTCAFVRGKSFAE